MLALEERFMIREMYRGGVSISEIARRIGRKGGARSIEGLRKRWFLETLASSLKTLHYFFVFSVIFKFPRIISPESLAQFKPR